MKIFLVDKSLSGLLSALYYSFNRNVFPDDVKEKNLAVFSFTDEFVEIEPDISGENRVKKALVGYGGTRSLNAAEICLLSCEEKALKTAFDFLYLTLFTRKSVIENLSDKRVCDFLYTVKKVLSERHRLTGFIRFKETARGVLYAPFSPDNDITVLLMPHFIKRLSFRPFVIHDVGRGVVGIYDGKSYKIVKTTASAEIIVSSDEKEWENLFKSYYNAVNIEERKNIRQQDGFMPRRYRKFMPETYE